MTDRNTTNYCVKSVALFLAFIFLTVTFSGMTQTTTGARLLNHPALDNYLHVGMQDEPKSLNPAISNDRWTDNFLRWIWDSTTAKNPDNDSVQPWIATNWYMVGSDGKNFTAQYRLAPYTYVNDSGIIADKPIIFHDGHEVDIYDILFSYELSMQVPMWSSGFESLDKTPNGTVKPPECTDDSQKVHLVRGISMDVDPAKRLYTLHFRLNRTDASWLTNLLTVKIFPYHLWKDKFYAGLFNTWNIENEADPAHYEVGSGMFKYNVWLKGGQFAQLDRYDLYFPWNRMPRDSAGNPPPGLAGKTWLWEIMKSPRQVDPTQTPWGARKPIPTIDGIKYHIYYSVDTAILALQNGDVDVNWFSIDPGYIPTVSSNPNIQLISSESRGFVYLTFNMRKPTFGYDDWASPLRKDIGKPLRMATELCTDKDSIVKRLIMGYASMGRSMVSPYNKIWYNNSVMPYFGQGFDPVAAEKTLKDAGYIKDASGWYDLGPPIGASQFEVIHTTKDYDSVRYEAARMIVEKLRSININAVSKPLQYGQVVERLRTRNFDVCLFEMTADNEPDYLFQSLDTSQATSGLSNHPGFHNDTIDALLEAAMVETNYSKRVDMVRDVQGMVAQNCPYDVLYYRSNIEAYHRDRWNGWTSTYSGIMNAWSFWSIHSPVKMMNVKCAVNQVVYAGKTTTFNVTVKDSSSSAPVAFANVTATVSAGAGLPQGNFVGVGRTTTIITDTNGFASFSWKAPIPYPKEFNRTVWFDVVVEKPSFNASGGEFNHTIVKLNQPCLYAHVDRATSTLKLSAGKSGTLEISVVDENGTSVPGATVDISCTPSGGLSLPATAVTNSTGEVSVSFTTLSNGTFTVTIAPRCFGKYTLSLPDAVAVRVGPVGPIYEFPVFCLMLMGCSALVVLLRKRRARK